MTFGGLALYALAVLVMEDYAKAVSWQDDAIALLKENTEVNSDG